ncbi:hypothetical protein [Sinosporangium siamense]|uniref:hypothetical protein n=1 Tax=Sinosporangium siamense TaxID=1367973 RepID=UPI0019518F21|nr:hypothetical protein [Sinosporangium siamense]
MPSRVSPSAMPRLVEGEPLMLVVGGVRLAALLVRHRHECGDELDRPTQFAAANMRQELYRQPILT